MPALIGWASGATLGRDELTLRFVARGDPARESIRACAGSAGWTAGSLSIEAPRYAQFTELMIRLAAAPGRARRDRRQ